MIPVIILITINERVTKMGKTIYDFTCKSIGGQDVSLSNYKDKVVVIVNTASKCGFTPQLEGLEKLYEKYSDQGLVILGFPCNQFNEQDPGSDKEISEFCSLNYGVKFPMFSKIEVNGANEDALYTFLKSEKGFAGWDPNAELTPVLIDICGKQDLNYASNPDIKWNFTKFLVGKNGEVIERFESTATPEQMEEAVKTALKA